MHQSLTNSLIISNSYLHYHLQSSGDSHDYEACALGLPNHKCVLLYSSYSIQHFVRINHLPIS